MACIILTVNSNKSESVRTPTWRDKDVCATCEGLRIVGAERLVQKYRAKRDYELAKESKSPDSDHFRVVFEAASANSDKAQMERDEHERTHNG